MPDVPMYERCADDFGESSQCPRRAEFRLLGAENTPLCGEHLLTHLRRALRQDGGATTATVMPFISPEER